jgi:hypothetical protein
LFLKSSNGCYSSGMKEPFEGRVHKAIDGFYPSIDTDYIGVK